LPARGAEGDAIGAGGVDVLVLALAVGEGEVELLAAPAVVEVFP
jgi:hypothetical protein